MSHTKRKADPELARDSTRKKPKKGKESTKAPSKDTFISETATDSDPIVESDTASQSGEDDGVEWPGDEDEEDGDWSGLEGDDDGGGVKVATKVANAGLKAATSHGPSTGTSSREAHAKQKVEKQERKAAKPNADLIARSKKLWERLRRKSHIPLEERKVLVAELLDIITGRVKDFVFKHDSVRVIQTALKYANLDQRKFIIKEMKGEYKTLAESRYAKFLIGKMLVNGDNEIRDIIVPEFFGHARRLIKHPEASWILDDIYRGAATPSQKATLLLEWYGAEYALFKSNEKGPVSADLTDLLTKHPEKRTPTMRLLYDLINLLVQKKTTGFTMLHDAMLQYFLNVTAGSEETSNFIELLKGDEEGDLLKNLAFTKSGARLVSLAIAHGNAKDRKHILRIYKGVIQAMAHDPYGHQILLTIFDVIDDTVLVSKSVSQELVAKTPLPPEREQLITAAISHINGRIPLLYPFCPSLTPALLPAEDIKLLNEVHRIRATTSKKNPEIRRKEHVNSLSAPLLSLITNHMADLVSTSFGCQFIGEVLPEAVGDRAPAMATLAALVSGNEEEQALFRSPHAGRMLKKLVIGGRYNKETKSVDPIDPPLGFHDVLYKAISEDLVNWAIGVNSFSIVGLIEAPGFSHVADVKKELRKTENVSRLQVAATDNTPVKDRPQGEMKGKVDNESAARGNRGTQLLLRLLNE